MVLASGSYTGTIDLFLFNANPAGTYSDQASFALASSDFGKLIGIAHLTDVTQAGVVSSVQATGWSQGFALSGTTLYVVPVVRSAVTLAASAAATPPRTRRGRRRRRPR